MFFKKRKATAAPAFVHAYDDDFQQLVEESDGIAIVDFWAAWCGPCRMMEPILGEIAHEFAEQNVRVVKVDVDQAPVTAEAFGIRSIPTIIFFKNGEPLFEMVGAVPKPVLAREIGTLLAE